jgi:hypothetical protein
MSLRATAAELPSQMVPDGDQKRERNQELHRRG